MTPNATDISALTSTNSVEIRPTVVHASSSPPMSAVCVYAVRRGVYAARPYTATTHSMAERGPIFRTTHDHPTIDGIAATKIGARRNVASASAPPSV